MYGQDLKSLELKASKLEENGRYLEAEKIWERLLLDFGSKIADSELPTYTSVKERLAQNLMRQSKWESAERLLEEILLTKRGVLGDLHEEVANTLSTIAELMYRKGEFGRAEPHALLALSIYRRLHGKHDERLITPTQNLILIYQQLGNSHKRQIEQLQFEVKNIARKGLPAVRPFTQKQRKSPSE